MRGYENHVIEGQRPSTCSTAHTPLIKGDKIMRQRKKMSIACMNMTVNTKLIKPHVGPVQTGQHMRCAPLSDWALRGCVVAVRTKVVVAVPLDAWRCLQNGKWQRNNEVFPLVCADPKPIPPCRCPCSPNIKVEAAHQKSGR